MSIIIEDDRASRHQHGHHGDHDNPEPCETRVKVPFNNKEVFVHKGELSVETLKRLAAIALTDDLDQLVGSKIVALPDNGKVLITGCEVFLHHPKDGGSS
jgi:hypothetical protein